MKVFIEHTKYIQFVKFTSPAKDKKKLPLKLAKPPSQKLANTTQLPGACWITSEVKKASLHIRERLIKIRKEE